MSQATTLLISQSPELIDSIDEVVGSLHNSTLLVRPKIKDGIECLVVKNLSLVVVHLADHGDEERVSRLLREVTARHNLHATLVVSDRKNPDLALSFLRLGAADFLELPADSGRLAFLIDVLTIRSRYKAGTSEEKTPSLQRLGEIDPFLYGAGEITKIVQQVQKVSRQNSNILLTGETGTGKTRLAHLIHQLSPRRDKPFLSVNCATISSSLTESELFGHCEGAFTGAESDRVGKFVESGGGTLLLDDIDTLSSDIQGKLLQAVDEPVFEPVGSNRTIKVESRLIAATNCSLEDLVREGRFRSDLYFRLNVVEFRLLPLRERCSEIRDIAEYFISETSDRIEQPTPHLTVSAVELLENYHWMGNIRELRNVIERCVSLGNGLTIRAEDLPDRIRKQVSQSITVRNSTVDSPSMDASHDAEQIDIQTKWQTSRKSVEIAGTKSYSTSITANLSALAKTRIEAEISRIISALDAHGNNRVRAARELGISRVAFYKKLHKCGLI